MRSHLPRLPFAFGLTLALFWLPLLAVPTNGPTITEQQKIAIIQDVVNTVGIARQPFPPGKKGFVLDPQGKMLNRDQVIATMQSDGVSAKLGDRIAITAIEFKDETIVFAVNGGPAKSHWYQHVEVGMGGTTSATPLTPSGPKGTYITVKFSGKLPAVSPETIRAALNTLIDWDPPAKATVMVQALPATVKTAIEQKRVLVGMTEDMVIAALGRTGSKDRETDPASGNEFEDWIYGTPPAQTQFVRFVDNRVVRITTYKPDGTQVVDNTPDPSLLELEKRQDRTKATEAAAEAVEPSGAQGPPTLRRPGDPAPIVPTGGTLPGSNSPPGQSNGPVMNGGPGGPPNSGCCVELR